MKIETPNRRITQAREITVQCWKLERPDIILKRDRNVANDNHTCNEGYLSSSTLKDTFATNPFQFEWSSDINYTPPISASSILTAARQSRLELKEPNQLVTKRVLAILPVSFYWFIVSHWKHIAIPTQTTKHHSSLCKEVVESCPYPNSAEGRSPKAIYFLL